MLPPVAPELPVPPVLPVPSVRPDRGVGHEVSADACLCRVLPALRRSCGDQGRGYAVSLVKAGVRLRGLDVGEVRPPLDEPAGDHVKRLAQLIERGLALIEEAK
ncbi:5-dehydro-4-deoxyglucarate dehydratase [Streptomyces hirsutus]